MPKCCTLILKNNLFNSSFRLRTPGGHFRDRTFFMLRSVRWHEKVFAVGFAEYFTSILQANVNDKTFEKSWVMVTATPLNVRTTLADNRILRYSPPWNGEFWIIHCQLLETRHNILSISPHLILLTLLNDQGQVLQSATLLFQLTNAKFLRYSSNLSANRSISSNYSSQFVPFYTYA
jgi:hypothetical protein